MYCKIIFDWDVKCNKIGIFFADFYTEHYNNFSKYINMTKIYKEETIEKWFGFCIMEVFWYKFPWMIGR